MIDNLLTILNELQAGAGVLSGTETAEYASVFKIAAIDSPASCTSERDLVAENKRLSLALQTLHGAEWHYDVATEAFHASEEVSVLIGEPSPRAIAWSEWLDRVHPKDRDAFRGMSSLDGTREFRFRAGNDMRWARCTRTAIRNEEGRVVTVLGVMVDITDERGREIVLTDLATHDPLTGLLNRRGFRQAVDELQADRPVGAGLALFMLDLDAFKSTNDSHGHAAGDAVLVETGRRLVKMAGDDAICARLGGDEFIVVARLSEDVDHSDLRMRLTKGFQQPLAFMGKWLSMSASVGVACERGAFDVVRLMKDADTGLYDHKHGRACQQSSAA